MLLYFNAEATGDKREYYWLWKEKENIIKETIILFFFVILVCIYNQHWYMSYFSLIKNFTFYAVYKVQSIVITFV